MKGMFGLLFLNQYHSMENVQALHVQHCIHL